jgi:hypothetical protein
VRVLYMLVQLVSVLWKKVDWVGVAITKFDC